LAGPPHKLAPRKSALGAARPGRIAQFALGGDRDAGTTPGLGAVSERGPLERDRRRRTRLRGDLWLGCYCHVARSSGMVRLPALPGLGLLLALVHLRAVLRGWVISVSVVRCLRRAASRGARDPTDAGAQAAQSI